MRSLGTRRVALAAGVATVAVIALGGCSAGQVAETALLQAPISGLNTQTSDGRLLIRDLEVIYNNPQGYPANSNAPLTMNLYNTTEQELTVLVSSRPLQDEQAGIVSARQIGLSGGTAAASPSAAPEPSGSRSANSGLPGDQDQNGGVSQPSTQPSLPPTPSAPPAASLEPARITLPPLGDALFIENSQQQVVAAGLSDALRPGNSLSLVFEVSGDSQPLEVLAPFAVPLSPASRAPGIAPEKNLGEGND